MPLVHKTSRHLQPILRFDVIVWSEQHGLFPIIGSPIKPSLGSFKISLANGSFTSGGIGVFTSGRFLPWEPYWKIDLFIRLHQLFFPVRLLLPGAAPRVAYEDRHSCNHRKKKIVCGENFQFPSADSCTCLPARQNGSHRVKKGRRDRFLIEPPRGGGTKSYPSSY